MQLIIDIGNTQSKIALFAQGVLIDQARVQHHETERKIKAIIESHDVLNIGYANVGSAKFDLGDRIKTIPVYNIRECDLPISIEYKTPNTLGTDRLCAAVAAWHRYPDHACLSIDLGTCITYDLIVSGCYIGGGIAPGVQMRLKAMHQFTERLPQVELGEDFMEIGRDTSGSLSFGAGFGTLAEINGMIHHFKASYPDLKVILTGGDHSIFEQHIENPIFAAPNLVLEGINEILLHHIAHRS